MYFSHGGNVRDVRKKTFRYKKWSENMGPFQIGATRVVDDSVELANNRLFMPKNVNNADSSLSYTVQCHAIKICFCITSSSMTTTAVVPYCSYVS